MNRTIDFNTAPDHLLLTPVETAELLSVSTATLTDGRLCQEHGRYVYITASDGNTADSEDKCGDNGHR